jgi:peptidoglycan/LPS O-acetylase OafA/YrhL
MGRPQQLFFVGRVYAGTHPLGILERTPLRFVASLALAMSSYYLVERPLIRLGHKLAPPATLGRGDLLIGTQKEAVASSSTTIPESAEGGVADAKDL